MRFIFYILIFLTNMTFSQSVNMTKPEIEKYVNKIDRLKLENKLVKVFYPNMSGCGGGLYGYYLNKELVLINATYNAELGFSSKKIYINKQKTLKIIYREHSAEWGKYEQNYPHEKFDYDPSKMTYSDTVYSITLTKPIIFRKKSNDILINESVDKLLIDRLISCSKEMTKELQQVVQQIDSLKFITEIPYDCKGGINEGDLFWKAVMLRESGIELLIDKLNDTTLTKANVILYGGNYTVADITFVVLNEIIHDIPTFELLGVAFDKNGCGYCSYWQHLNKDYKNRLKFKEAVRTWYHSNKKELTWIESNDFAICDCRSKHPNNGHYELKTKGKINPNR